MVTWASDIGPDGRQALIQAARASISRQPDFANGWIVLGTLLMESGRFEEAEHVLKDGSTRLPEVSQIHLLMARACQQIGDLDAALIAAETALSLVPHDREARLRRFDLLVRSRRWNRVSQDLENMTMLAPARTSVIHAHAHFTRSGGDPNALLAVCEAALVHKPGHTLALHHKAVALSMLGRTAEACSIMGLDDFVSLGELPLRDKRIGDTTFLDAVAAEILDNPTLLPDWPGKATRDGYDTRALIQASDKAVPLLLEQIKLAIEHYVEALPASPHPFTTVRASRVRLHAWAVVYPHDGRQKSHLHPAGWISGVTYVTAPRIAGESNYRGPLIIGELNVGPYPNPPPWGIHEVEPVPGRIVLFPSFVPHATRPTGVAQQRISVAFDVVPA